MTKENIPKKRKLTDKQKAFVHKIAIEKKTGTQAAMEAYNIGGKHGTTDAYNVAHSIASENLQKPAISSALDDLADKAKSILDRVLDWEKINNKDVNPRDVIDVSKYIHDKVHGKATQTIKQDSVNYNVDISSLSDDELIELSKTLAK